MKKLILTIILGLGVMFSAAPAFATNYVSKWQAVTDNGSFALRQSDYVDSKVLAANVAEVQTVPTYREPGGALKYANYVVYSATCNFYTRNNAAAAVPAADVTDGTSSELNPTVRYLAGAVTTIGLIAPTDCVVTMQFLR